MRINLISSIKYPVMAFFTACSIGYAAPAATQNTRLTTEIQDTFAYVHKEKINPVDKYTQEDLPEVFRETVNPSSWTNDPNILKNAPDPYFTLKGKRTLAKIVVEINNCRLYVYDENGIPIESFKVANGTPSTPTRAGIRQVLAKQTYPYKNLPKNTKRYRFPRDYGPKIAYLKEVDTITGDLHDRGAYFHGTKHESAIMPELPKNRLKTHSCTRVHNRDALYIINDVLKIGDYFKFVK